MWKSVILATTSTLPAATAIFVDVLLANNAKVEPTIRLKQTITVNTDAIKIVLLLFIYLLNNQFVGAFACTALTET